MVENFDAVVYWGLSSGVPVSMLYDQGIQLLLSRAHSANSVLLSKLYFAIQVQNEYA